MAIIDGINIIYLLRVKGDKGDAFKIAYQTEGSREESRSYETTATKDGAIKTAGAYEGSHSLTCLLAEDDEYIQKLEDLVRVDSPKQLEVWRINRNSMAEADTTELPGEYSLDRVTSISSSEPTEGSVEISIESEIEIKPIRGKVKVSEKLKALLAQISAEQAQFLQPIQEGSSEV